jgi:hypothetical protein
MNLVNKNQLVGVFRRLLFIKLIGKFNLFIKRLPLGAAFLCFHWDKYGMIFIKPIHFSVAQPGETIISIAEMFKEYSF